MNEEFTYKGFICTDGIKYRLVIKDSQNDKLFRTIPVTGSEDNFEKINKFTAYVVCVKFFDGTEQLSMERGIDVNFVDIFISIKGYALIHAISKKTIFDIIKDDYLDTCNLWEFVDEYFDSEKGKKDFEKYTKKNVWKIK